MNPQFSSMQSFSSMHIVIAANILATITCVPEVRAWWG
jgi:hypothetical protein